MGVLLDLRQAIFQRISNKSDAELQEIIDESIDGKEQVLPGLGVIFEHVWKNIDPSVKSQLITALQHSLKQTEQ
ncbi:small acid-soluble spore protein SspI [Paenibacillus sp. N1-5-1-14]|uniref:small acid-soluble spore protein SspI n=1 Tax=Paenibacillus radicibacter TaxID=2972488 RepID=UPI0021590104|nr:small acid-soluble spore protein SspI [Paenibacillus radicibacter]MCR8645336.1 small acid-soluble spore protein SspI [Paenibacillus radicibacter]